MPPRGAHAITVVAHEVRGDGGMEQAMMQTVLGLLALGWKVRLLARVCELDDHPGLRWIRIPTPRRPFAVAFPLFAVVSALLLTIMRRNRGLVLSLGAIVPNRVDTVVVQFCHAGFAHHGITQSSRANLLYRFHSRISRVLAVGLERWCYRSGRVTRMIAVSELIKHELESSYELSSVSVHVIPNGVDLDRFRPDAETRERERKRLGLSSIDPAALFVGGDWDRKGLGIAIDAAARADWTLIVVGRGDVAVWSAYAQRRGARTVFCGHLLNPERLYCAADAFLLPSRYEGFALVTIEAAACGLPLLLTEATGAAELAARAGLGVLPRDVDAFAMCLLALGRDPALRREIGAKARAAVEELSWPHIVSEYAGVLSLSGA